MIPFTKKYQPASLAEIKGQDEALKQIKRFISGGQKKKALLLYGPSGSGKTSSVYALTNDNELEIVEVNASDFRNKDQINQKVGSAVKQQSLFSKGKLILIDEVDGLSGNKDRGGIQALIKLIGDTTFPIILTCQNPWDYKFNKLRRRCSLVEFRPMGYSAIFEVLKEICDKEKIKYKPDILKSLARRAGGDCRSAINDLQMLIGPGKELKSLDEMVDRDREESMPSALVRIFKTTDPKIAITAFDNVRENVDDQFLWIDANLPREYEKAEDLARAYDKLSKADIFRRRIRRWQHWRFLVYINALLTAGVAVSKDEKYKKMVQYKPTGRLLKMWWAKQKSLKKRAIAAKIGEKTHSSTNDVIKDIEYFRVIFRKNKEMAKAIADYLDLDKEEIKWLKNK